MKISKLEASKFIPAEISKVFNAWITPQIVEKWFCPEGMKSQVIEWNATVNGKFDIAMIDGDDVYPTNGIFKEIIPNQKLVLVYGWDIEEDESAENLKVSRIDTLITVEFNNLAEGTNIVLTQEGVDPEEIESLQVGWMSALANLASVI
ncbi:MAG: SRPBCC domain-containing protein [Bacteriovorax sp.]|nr:SRPBCC domain-containing protein [Bacteriovorax sp.]